MMIYDRSTQRNQIQEAIDKYFKRRIEIGPRAMAALQGRWCEKDPEMDLPTFIPSLSIFEGLISSSPSCLLLLFESGLSVEDLFSKGLDEEPASLLYGTLEMIFEGNLESDYGYELCPTGEDVKRKGSLTALNLFSAFLETAYRGPKFFFENVDKGVISKHCTDVGHRLLKSASIEPISVIEAGERKWTEELQKEFIEEVGFEFSGLSSHHYVARSIAENFFNSLTRRINEILVADPSNDRFQFALWQDKQGSIRLSPFGVGNLGSLEPYYSEADQQFIFREGIFQPLSSILPDYTDDKIHQLEEMINSKSATESDFQKYFECNQELIRGLDYHTIHPQLVLYSDEGPDLVPDFMLEPMSSKFCDLLELKLPYQSLVTRLRRESRVHFRAAINEAISQLIEYRRYFESKHNRKDFHSRYGLEAYNPKMILVVGRKHHFKSDLERRELQSLLPKDLEIWTYDDLLSRAKIYRNIF